MPVIPALNSAETGESLPVQGQPGSHSDFQASLLATAHSSGICSLSGIGECTLISANTEFAKFQMQCTLQKEQSSDCDSGSLGHALAAHRKAAWAVVSKESVHIQLLGHPVSARESFLPSL